MKTLVVYDSLYGNTRIAEGFSVTGGEVSLIEGEVERAAALAKGIFRDGN